MATARRPGGAVASTRALAAAGVFALASACGDAGGGGCPAADPDAQVAGARPGDVLSLPSCVLTGPVALPPGATLEGAPGAPVIVVVDDGTAVALRLSPGDGTTRVHHVVVRGRAAVAVRGTDVQGVELGGVRVETRQGLGVVLEAVGTATLTDVTLVGTGPETPEAAEDVLFANVSPTTAPGDADSCPTVADPCSPGEVYAALTCDGLPCGTYDGFCDACGVRRTLTTTTALFARDVASLRLEDVTIDRYASFGAVLAGDERARATWTRGRVARTVGVGVYVAGAEVTLDGVDLAQVFQGVRAFPAIGVLQAADAASAGALVTRDLAIADSAGFGLYQIGGRASHGGLAIDGTDQAGLWAVGADRVDLSGGRVARAALAGLALVDVAAASLEGGLVVERTRLRARPLAAPGGGFAVLEAGDGVHLVRSVDEVALRDVILERNERVGVAVLLAPGASLTPDTDLCRAGAGLCFERVRAEGEGEQRGALAGLAPDVNAPVVDYEVVADGIWAEGIERLGSAAMDANVDGELPGIGVTGPIDAPSPTGVTGPIDRPRGP